MDILVNRPWDTRKQTISMQMHYTQACFDLMISFHWGDKRFLDGIGDLSDLDQT